MDSFNAFSAADPPYSWTPFSQRQSNKCVRATWMPKRKTICGNRCCWYSFNSTELTILFWILIITWPEFMLPLYCSKKQAVAGNYIPIVSVLRSHTKYQSKADTAHSTCKAEFILNANANAPSMCAVDVYSLPIDRSQNANALRHRRLSWEKLNFHCVFMSSAAAVRLRFECEFNCSACLRCVYRNAIAKNALRSSMNLA